MNWFKENPFLAGLASVTLVIAGVLGYLISQSALTYSSSLEAYTANVAKLHGLQNKAPFPSKENLAAIQAALDDYSARIQEMQARLAKMEVPLDEKVTPQQFQDGLRTAVNDIRAKADAGHVKLPDKFYFGFDQYQTQVPTEQAAPALFRQFQVVQSLVSRLVDFKVASVDAIVRPPLPEEGPQSPAKNPASPEPVIKRFPFDISFTAEQGKFRAVFNSLLGSTPFLIVRSLGIQNTSPQAPVKASGEDPSNPANPIAAIAGERVEEKKSLQVILGRELLKVTLRLEMLDFAEPVVPKK